MYVNGRLNGEKCQALVDTGAAPWRRRVICEGYDGRESRSSGMATVTVSLGGTSFPQEFVIAPQKKSKLIFGNDLLKGRKAIIDCAGEKIVLPGDHVIPCHVVNLSFNAGRSLRRRLLHLKHCPSNR